MDNKKIVSVAVLAVLALAFAGYGYAEYTASTYNEGNNVAVNYITVIPSQWDAIVEAENVDLDTYTYDSQNSILYVLGDTSKLSVDEETGVGTVQLGKDYTLTIGGTTGDTAFDIEVIIQGTVATVDNFKLYLQCDNEDPVLLESGMKLKGVSSEVTLKLLMQVTGYNEKINFPVENGWTEYEGTTTGPGENFDGALLTGLEDVTDVPADTPAGAIFIFKVTPAA